MRRARTAEAALVDPEAAAWTLRTRTRYDENGNFTLTISGPAQFLPELQAGIDAKKAELQRERDAQAAGVPAGTPADEAERIVDVPAGAAAQAEESFPIGNVPAGTPVPADADLDDPAQGWPAGTTRRQVQEAIDAFVAAQEYRRVEAAGEGDIDDDGSGQPPAELPARPRFAATPADVPAEAPQPATVTDAEALLALARGALAAEQVTAPDVSRRRRPQVTARIDPVSGWGRQADGELLPPSSLGQVMKTLPDRGGLLRLRPVTDADLRRHDLGREQRGVSASLRELLGGLDGERCRFPGCTRHRKLHAHHVVYWSDGGRTDLANLVLVCSRHHNLVHSLGFQLVLHPDRRLEVRTADDVPVLHHPAQPWGDPAALDPARCVSAGTLPPDHCDTRLDLRYAVSVLMQPAS